MCDNVSVDYPYHLGYRIIDLHTIEYMKPVNLQTVNTHAVTSTKENITRIEFTEPIHNLDLIETKQNGTFILTVKPKNKLATTQHKLCSSVRGSKSNGSLLALTVSKGCTAAQLAAALQ